LPVHNSRIVYEPKVNEVYEIVSADDFTSRNNNEGVNIEMKSKNNNDQRIYGLMLWLPNSDSISALSKWGAFASVLGDDTDKWLHKWVRIITLTPRATEILLEKAPKQTLKEAAKRAGAAEEVFEKGGE
jgi:hypothetical protein